MSFQSIVQSSQIYFPRLEIKYKNESIFMKILGMLLFFNPAFMTSYTTTIGSTIYFPDQRFIVSRETSSSIILLHELVHIIEPTHNARFIELMDLHLPTWRSIRRTLNSQPLAYASWDYWFGNYEFIEKLGVSFHALLVGKPKPDISVWGAWRFSLVS